MDVFGVLTRSAVRVTENCLCSAVSVVMSILFGIVAVLAMTRVAVMLTFEASCYIRRLRILVIFLMVSSVWASLVGLPFRGVRRLSIFSIL